MYLSHSHILMFTTNTINHFDFFHSTLFELTKLLKVYVFINFFFLCNFNLN